MKLISVQSRGDRLVRVIESEIEPEINCECLQIDKENRCFRLKAHAINFDIGEATKAAAKWLEGARI